LQERIERNLAILDAALAGCDFATRLEREGGWYAVLRLTRSARAAEAASDEVLAAKLVERCDILVHPGSFFNFASDGFLVLSLIVPTSEFDQGVHRLVDFLIAL
jgi:aspartate/methionine/tyrosine aminotransferase